MPLLSRVTLLALLFGASSSQSIAQEWLTNMEGGIADCDIRIDGKPFITDQCQFHFSGAGPESLYIENTDYYGTDYILPTKRIRMDFEDGNLSRIGYVGFLERGMSRYGDGYVGDAMLSFTNGCFKAGSVSGCLKYISGGNSSASETAFRQMPIQIRRGIQQFLSLRNYYDGDIDGAWGSMTANALRKYGDVNELLAKLYSDHARYNLSLFSQNILLFNDAMQDQVQESSEVSFSFSNFCYEPEEVRGKIDSYKGSERVRLVADHVRIYRTWCEPMTGYNVGFGPIVISDADRAQEWGEEQ
jgi:hypothetical protein